MKLRIKVEWKSAGEARNVQVTTTLATIVAWERHFKRKASEFGSAAIGMEDILFLAWTQLGFLKLESRTFDEWLPDVENVEVLDMEDPGPPTKPDTSGDN